MGIPSTGQRGDAASPNKTDRYKTARILDAPKHKRSNMNKGALGVEETSHYQAHYRFVIKLDRRRFDRIRSTAWGIKSLSCLRSTSEPGIPMPPYAATACVEYVLPSQLVSGHNTLTQGSPWKGGLGQEDIGQVARSWRQHYC